MYVMRLYMTPTCGTITNKGRHLMMQQKHHIIFSGYKHPKTYDA